MKRIDALFAIEREINGRTTDERLAVRRERGVPLVAKLEDWMRTERARLSRHANLARAFDYMLTRWPAFARFLDDGRVCLSNNAAERALRGVAVGRKNWTFAGSDAGGYRAAVFNSLIVTARLNDVEPQQRRVRSGSVSTLLSVRLPANCRCTCRIKIARNSPTASYVQQVTTLSNF